MSQDRWITVEDGAGYRKTISEAAWPMIQQAYAEQRAAATKLGLPPEEIAEYTVRIVKEDVSPQK